MKLRVSPGFDPMKAKVGPEEYFVLSRIDGALTLREVLLQTGLPVERGIAIITKLRSLGALLLPGESAAPASTQTGPAPARQAPAQARPQAPAAAPARATASGSAPPASTAGATMQLVLPNPTEAERGALAEQNNLSIEVRTRILAMVRLVAERDPWALLGVPNGASAKELKRAYFKLSKDIHPDRFYGKQLGSFTGTLALVFEAVSRAYERLTSPAHARTSGAHPSVEQQEPQTPQEYAAELFQRACSLEVGGDPLEAMKLFAAAVRMDPQTRYLRRAATCALSAGQPKTALEYAKKAQAQQPNDPSSARLLATAFRATGKLEDAEEILVMAMAMKSENDVLTSELRHDLAEVRRLMSG